MVTPDVVQNFLVYQGRVEAEAAAYEARANAVNQPLPVVARVLPESFVIHDTTVTNSNPVRSIVPGMGNVPGKKGKSKDTYNNTFWTFASEEGGKAQAVSVVGQAFVNKLAVCCVGKTRKDAMGVDTAAGLPTNLFAGTPYANVYLDFTAAMQGYVDRTVAYRETTGVAATAVGSPWGRAGTLEMIQLGEFFRLFSPRFNQLRVMAVSSVYKTTVGTEPFYYLSVPLAPVTAKEVPMSPLLDSAPQMVFHVTQYKLSREMAADHPVALAMKTDFSNRVKIEEVFFKSSDAQVKELITKWTTWIEACVYAGLKLSGWELGMDKGTGIVIKPGSTSIAED